MKDDTNKRKPKRSCSLNQSLLFLVYWLIIWSLLFLLWTSKPPGGALDNSSCSSLWLLNATCEIFQMWINMLHHSCEIDIGVGTKKCLWSPWISQVYIWLNRFKSDQICSKTAAEYKTCFKTHSGSYWCYALLLLPPFVNPSPLLLTPSPLPQ